MYTFGLKISPEPLQFHLSAYILSIVLHLWFFFFKCCGLWFVYKAARSYWKAFALSRVQLFEMIFQGYNCLKCFIPFVQFILIVDGVLICQTSCAFLKVLVSSKPAGAEHCKCYSSRLTENWIWMYVRLMFYLFYILVFFFLYFTSAVKCVLRSIILAEHLKCSLFWCDRIELLTASPAGLCL